MPPKKRPSKQSKNLVLTNFSKYFFVIAVIAVITAFLWVISPFLNVLIYAALLAILFNPVQKWLVKKLKKRRSLAAFLSTLLVMLIVLTPLILFVIFMAQEAVDAYQVLERELYALNFTEFKGIEDLPYVGQMAADLIERYGVGGLLESADINLFNVVRDIGEGVSTFLVNQSGTILKSVGDTVMASFIFLLALFYGFRDGNQFVTFIKDMSPLPPHHEEEIEKKLKDSTVGIIVGNFGTAILQGLVAMIGFFIAGVENAFFWGAIMAFASLIPYVGAAIIWVPAALLFFIQGQYFWGIFLIAWGMLLVSSVDNLARPYLIGSSSKMHPLATFLVVLGGILLFGLKGIIFGPLILSLTITVIHIYQLEYKDVLQH